jgi:hypothetical protein
VVLLVTGREVKAARGSTIPGRMAVVERLDGVRQALAGEEAVGER